MDASMYPFILNLYNHISLKEKFSNLHVLQDSSQKQVSYFDLYSTLSDGFLKDMVSSANPHFSSLGIKMFTNKVLSDQIVDEFEKTYNSQVFEDRNFYSS